MLGNFASLKCYTSFVIHISSDQINGIIQNKLEILNGDDDIC